VIDALQTLSWFLALSAGLLGLLVGSFLNVVIHRLPLMMQRDWQMQCHELMQMAEEKQPERYDLVVPRSRCPHCGHNITAFENIPLLSYLALKGKCSACGAGISLRYPIIELLTAALSVIVVMHFGFGWSAVAALVLTWGLIALTFIDLDHQLLPDSITLPLLWGGLMLSLGPVWVDSQTAIIGAAAGYLSLWSVYWLFKLVTGKEGMGQGDFKLLAVFGAGLGGLMLPLIILLSSLVGAVVGVALILFRGQRRDVPIPFGPYLAAAGWIALLWGMPLTQAYLDLLGG
jgi:leader peptidase (prepilin peptidase)/N-methyltransferase